MTDSVTESNRNAKKQYLKSTRMHKIKRPVFGPSKSVIMHEVTKTRSFNKNNTSECRSDSCVFGKNVQLKRKNGTKKRRLALKSSKYGNINNKKRVSPSLKYYLSGKYMPADYSHTRLIEERNYNLNQIKSTKNPSRSTLKTAIKSKSMSTTRVKTKKSKLMWKRKSLHDTESFGTYMQKEGILISSIGDGKSKYSNKTSRVTFKEDRRTNVNHLLLTATERIQRGKHQKHTYKLNAPINTSTPKYTLSLRTQTRNKINREPNERMPYLQKYDRRTKILNKLYTLKHDMKTTNKIKGNDGEDYLCLELDSDNNQSISKESITTAKRRGKALKSEMNRPNALNLELQRANALKLELEKANADRSQMERAFAVRLEINKTNAQTLQTESETQKENAEILQIGRINAEKFQKGRVIEEKIQIERADAKKIQIERANAERLQTEKANVQSLQIQTANAQRLQILKAIALKEDMERAIAVEDEIKRAEAMQEREKELETIMPYSNNYMAKPCTRIKPLKKNRTYKIEMTNKYNKRLRARGNNDSKKVNKRRSITEEQNAFSFRSLKDLSTYSNLDRNDNKRNTKESKAKIKYAVTTSISSGTINRSSKTSSVDSKTSNAIIKKASSSIITLGNKVSRVMKEFGLKSWSFFNKSPQKHDKPKKKDRLKNLPNKQDLYLAMTDTECSRNDENILIRNTFKG